MAIVSNPIIGTSVSTPFSTATFCAAELSFTLANVSRSISPLLVQPAPVVAPVRVTLSSLLAPPRATVAVAPSRSPVGVAPSGSTLKSVALIDPGTELLFISSLKTRVRIAPDGIFPPETAKLEEALTSTGPAASVEAKFVINAFALPETSSIPPAATVSVGIASVARTPSVRFAQTTASPELPSSITPLTVPPNDTLKFPGAIVVSSTFSSKVAIRRSMYPSASTSAVVNVDRPGATPSVTPTAEVCVDVLLPAPGRSDATPAPVSATVPVSPGPTAAASVSVTSSSSTEPLTSPTGVAFAPPVVNAANTKSPSTRLVSETASLNVTNTEVAVCLCALSTAGPALSVAVSIVSGFVLVARSSILPEATVTVGVRSVPVAPGVMFNHTTASSAPPSAVIESTVPPPSIVKSLVDTVESLIALLKVTTSRSMVPSLFVSPVVTVLING